MVAPGIVISIRRLPPTASGAGPRPASHPRPLAPLLKRLLGSGKHTDKEDSARLAKMLALGTLPTVWVPPQPVREVRRLLGARERMLSMRTAAVNQAKAVLRRRGIASGRMRHDPTVLKELPPDERVLYTAALSQVASLDKTIHDLEAEIAVRLKDDEAFGHLLTITGVGATTAAIVWATIGDPGRFKTGKQVARYAGLDPSVMQSGETDRRGRISKNGSRRLRTALVEVAHTIGRLEQGYLGLWYRARASQKGKAKTAVALARKLVVVAWRLMLRGEDYHTVHTDRFERKHKEVERLAGERADWDAFADKVTEAFASRARRGQIRRKEPARKAG